MFLCQVSVNFNLTSFHFDYILLMKKTLYDIPVNEKLIWDYDWKEEDYKTERFFKWYLARVLTYGTAYDLQHIPFEIIKKYLPELNIPRRVAKFWFKYFNMKEDYKYGNLEQLAKKYSSDNRENKS